MFFFLVLLTSLLSAFRTFQQAECAKSEKRTRRIVRRFPHPRGSGRSQALSFRLRSKPQTGGFYLLFACPCENYGGFFLNLQF